MELLAIIILGFIIGAIILGLIQLAFWLIMGTVIWLTIQAILDGIKEWFKP